MLLLPAVAVGPLQVGYLQDRMMRRRHAALRSWHLLLGRHSSPPKALSPVGLMPGIGAILLLLLAAGPGEAVASSVVNPRRALPPAKLSVIVKAEGASATVRVPDGQQTVQPPRRDVWFPTPPLSTGLHDQRRSTDLRAAGLPADTATATPPARPAAAPAAAPSVDQVVAAATAKWLPSGSEGARYDWSRAGYAGGHAAVLFLALPATVPSAGALTAGGPPHRLFSTGGERAIPSSVGAGTFNVKSLGAKGDGRTLDDKAVKASDLVGIFPSVAWVAGMGTGNWQWLALGPQWVQQCRHARSNTCANRLNMLVGLCVAS